MIRRPPRSTQSRSSAASDVYKRQHPQGALGPALRVQRPDGGGDVTVRRRPERERAGEQRSRVHRSRTKQRPTQQRGRSRGRPASAPARGRHRHRGDIAHESFAVGRHRLPGDPADVVTGREPGAQQCCRCRARRRSDDDLGVSGVPPDVAGKRGEDTGVEGGPGQTATTEDKTNAGRAHGAYGPRATLRPRTRPHVTRRGTGRHPATIPASAYRHVTASYTRTTVIATVSSPARSPRPALVWRLRVITVGHQSLSLIHISEPTRLGMISYAVFCLK